MAGIVQTADTSHEEGFRPFLLPAVPDVPCGQLADAITDRAEALALPAWHLGTDPALVWPPARTNAGRLVASRELHGGLLALPRVPEFPRGGRLDGACWSVGHAADVLRPRLALALESADDLAWDLLDERDYGQLRRLHAAAARDVVGLGYEQLAGAFSYSDESIVREKVRSGRKLLRALGAWPWCAFDERGRPPRDWWTQGDALAHALLGWWESPDLLSAAGQALIDLY